MSFGKFIEAWEKATTDKRMRDELKLRRKQVEELREEVRQQRARAEAAERAAALNKAVGDGFSQALMADEERLRRLESTLEKCLAARDAMEWHYAEGEARAALEKKP